MVEQKAVTPQEMRAMDQHAITTLHIPVELLMERAALAVTLVTSTYLKQGLDAVKRANTINAWTGELSPNISLAGKHCLLLCGKGNNGGDGLAVARLLLQKGAEVQIFLTDSVEHYTGAGQTMARIVRALGQPFLSINDCTAQPLDKADIIIDALYGTGFKRAIQEPLASIFTTIEKLKKPVIAIDIPSGLDGVTGMVATIALHATVTVAMQCIKTGMVTGGGPDYCGEIVIAEIGIPS